jgi:glucose-1-phosphate adenylyltransferase
MNYNWMVQQHIAKGADATIAVIPVPLEEASRFGIMNTDEDLKIYEFEEKPEQPKSTLASMGVYCFDWPTLREYLNKDAENPESANDFGKNIIPAMLNGGEKLYAYRFEGYWKDVGTIRSLWEANMELLQDFPPLNLYDDPWRIFSRNPNEPPHYVDGNAVIQNSIISEGCYIYGTVVNSILSSGVTVGKGAVVRDSIIMTENQIGEGSTISMSILDEEVAVGKNCTIGEDKKTSSRITVLGKRCIIKDGASVEAGKQVDCDEVVKKTGGGRTSKKTTTVSAQTGGAK